MALELPGEVTAALHEWAAGVGEGRPELRVLAVESLHVTLAFLGWREETDLEGIGEIVKRSPGDAPALASAGAAWLPPRRPGVLAVDLIDESGALGALQASLSDALASEAGYEAEKRPYRPHVTVARVRRGKRMRDRSLSDPPRLEFPGTAVTLFRSRLQRAGAVYEPLVRAEFQTGGS